MKHITLRTMVACLASLLLLFVLGISFFRLYTYEPRRSFKGPDSASPKPFEADLTLSLLEQDLSRQEILADLIVKVEATDEKGEIHNVVFSPIIENSATGERSYTYIERSDPTVKRIVKKRPGSEALVNAIEAVQEIKLPLKVERQPVLYPFDSYNLA